MTMTTIKTNTSTRTLWRNCTIHCSQKERPPVSLDLQALKNTSIQKVW